MPEFRTCLLFTATLAACSAAPDATVVVTPRAPVQAQPAPAPSERVDPRQDVDAASTLEELRSIAAAVNPGLQSAAERWLAAEQRAPQTGAWPDPRLSYRYYIEEVETRVGPQNQAVGLSQVLPWPGRRDSKSAVSEAEAAAARARYRAHLAGVLESVETVWCEGYFLERAIVVVERNRELLASLEEVLRRRYASGDSAYPDLLRAQVELDKLLDRQRTLEDQRRPLAARLNALLDRDADAEVPRPDALPERELGVTEAELADWIREGSPELEALSHESEREARMGDVARLERRPDLMLGVEWIDTGPARMAGVPDSGKDPWIVSLSLNLPVWGGKLDAAEEQARATQRAANLAREEAARRLEADVEAALYPLRDAERRSELYQDTLLPRARQSFEAQEAAFRAGAAPFLDLIDAERTLLEFELALERARTDRALALARLERLAGRPLSDLEASMGVER